MGRFYNKALNYKAWGIIQATGGEVTIGEIAKQLEVRPQFLGKILSSKLKSQIRSTEHADFSIQWPTLIVGGRTTKYELLGDQIKGPEEWPPSCLS